MNFHHIVRAAAVTVGLAAGAGSASAAPAAYVPPSRFIVDLAPGSDPGRVAQVLQSQGIKVISAVDMPDGGAVAVEIEPKNPPNIAALRPLLPEVVGYSPDVPRQLLALDPSQFDDVVVEQETLPWGVQAVQASQVPFGVGRKVCIIDTGYAMGHPDLPVERVSGIDRGAGAWDGSDGYVLHPHGTHVAGTIAALGGNQRGVVGVVPSGALDLFIVRTFNGGALFVYAGELVAAMQDCADAGAHVISMSLGGAFASKAEERMVAKLTRQGILVVAAAGNDGNSTFSYPASYPGVLSVAAVDQTLKHASFSQYNSRVRIAAPGVNVLSTVPVGAGSDPYLTVGGVVYDPHGLQGSPQKTETAPLADFGLGNVSDSAMLGKVCLIQRGVITFAEKVQWCDISGGVAAVIYNNEPGAFDGGGLEGTEIPSVSVSDTDGARLKTQLGEAATVEVRPKDYDAYSGTSMATPHVSAVAALVWSHFPECTANHIRNALEQSALALTPSSSGQDYRNGKGLVQARAAVDYLATHPCQGTGSQFD
jgi:subtilisin family serine protease